MLARSPRSGALWTSNSARFREERADMTVATRAPSHRLRPLMAAICLGAASVLALPVLSVPALARGPDGIADVAEKVIDAVVNISTSQTVEAKGGPGGGEMQPHKTNSLGSGFIIDTAGIAVTNNHVIADADEINVIMNDGTKIKAELV